MTVLERRTPLSSGDEDGHLPGDKNMWIFVLGDLVIFAVYFIVFMVYRVEEPQLFRESQRHLNVTTGAINTLVLLASSRFVALAAQAARANDHRRAIRLVTYGGLCGIAFTVIKCGEWATEIAHGFTLPRNDFFMFYFMLTGAHLLHVLLGLLILGIVVYNLRDPRLRQLSVVESGATYWHMVDVVWVLIFALVYVMR